MQLCTEFRAFPEDMISITIGLSTEHACRVLSIGEGFAVWSPWESALDVAEEVGGVGFFKCGESTRKCGGKGMVSVVIVGDAGFVVGFGALKVLAGSRADEVGAKWPEEMARGFVDVDGRVPCGVDLVLDGERGTCAV